MPGPLVATQKANAKRWYVFSGARPSWPQRVACTTAPGGFQSGRQSRGCCGLEGRAPLDRYKRWIIQGLLLMTAFAQLAPASDSSAPTNSPAKISAAFNVSQNSTGTNGFAAGNPPVRKTVNESTEPRIAWVERINDLITVHVDTEPGRAYVVQFCDSLPAAKWVDLYSIRALPFPNHYVIADTLTNSAQRFYRLAVSP
jgi:hypothetical protein